MNYSGLSDFLSTGAQALAKGPIALILAEDLVEVDTTIRHHLNLGFKSLILFAPDELDLPADIGEKIHRVRLDVHREGALFHAINRVIEAASGQWLYYCYNAEYLFFPFCETRSIGEMLAFHTEERRDAMLAYVIDLYAGDLDRFPNAVSLETALLDKSGYYALARPDPVNKGHPKERQLDFFGGLRWRFEEHVPETRRKIDRIALFRAKPGLVMRPDHTFSDEEYNTYACPWHHNLTVAICSFRTAKALKSNAGSTFDIHNFQWHNSTEFKWTSQQLLDLGLMEPGQWF
ncbi:glycosyltransferase family 2 protein [Actibacterium sp. D379-3]